MGNSLLLMSWILFHILECTSAKEIIDVMIRFSVSKSCSCSEPFANFTVDFESHDTSKSNSNSISISDIVTTIDGHSDFVNVNINVTNNSPIVFRWTSIMSVNKTCCWSIDNVILTREEESVNVTLCYDDTVYQYENKTWICSEPNSEFGSEFKSGEYKLKKKNTKSKTENIKVKKKCTNSIQQPSSGLPCSNSMTPSSTIPQTSTDMTSDSSSSISSNSTNTVSLMTSDTSSSIPLTSTSTVSPMTSDSSSSISSSSSSSVILAPSSDVVLTCTEDGPWIQTFAGTNATIRIGECFKGTVNATRRCNHDGTWDIPYCIVPPLFSTVLSQIQDSPMEGLNRLLTINPSKDVSSEQYVYLLDSVFQEAVNLNLTAGRNFQQTFIDVSQTLITQVQSDRELDSDTSRSIGAQLLQTLDNFALNVAELSNETFALNDQLFSRISEFTAVPAATDITGIVSGNNFITLPPEILGEEITEPVRIASFLYQNLSNLLPPRDNNSSIISPVISSTTNCQSCPTDDLSSNVTIQLQLQVDTLSGVIYCVYFEFEDVEDSLPTGDWVTEGCSSTVDGDIVTCSCNHLTHFAILLSPGVEEISKTDVQVLTTLGIVLVPISLLCMVLVILTYSLMRSLWSMRNYIHIMLCVSLFMAQLVFILGVDKIENEGLCSAIAVLMQYLFLATFMWMLMEGVVLYVTLVKVFVQNHKYYIIGFTIASYVIPAVYMAIVVPIGFLVGADNIPDHTHYLYYNGNQSTACWLNYETGFIWSFIVPVTIILLVNVGFFIMAVVIMRRHTKKQEKKGTPVTVKHWLKASITLTLVMGFTWLAGLLVFRRELVYLAYIMTIFIAGQGILLFIILVPLSKQVREAYYKLWERKKSQSEFLTKISNVIPKSSIFSNSFTNNSDSLKPLHDDKSSGNVGGIVLGTFGDKSPAKSATEKGFESQLKFTDRSDNHNVANDNSAKVNLAVLIENDYEVDPKNTKDIVLENLYQTI